MNRREPNKPIRFASAARRWGRWLLVFSITGLSPWAAAQETLHAAASPKPAIVIIIDDIGDNLDAGLRAVRLPGPVTTAFLPHTRYARRLARVAHRHGKDVMLHLPMQADDGATPGPGAITLAMSEEEFHRTLQADLASIPHVAGINNHMGSLLTRQPQSMLWLMQAINRRGALFFVDSRTTAATVAQQVAAENGVPNLRRDVFLDNETTAAAIAIQFERLLNLARHNGSAVAIGHPHGATLDFLEQRLPQLEAEGIRIVSVQTLLQQRQLPATHQAAQPSATELASANGNDPARETHATP